MTAGLTILDLCASVGRTTLLTQVHLELDRGSYGVVLGPSGAGKSSLLRAVAGLLPATGVVRIGSTTVQDGREIVPPERRGLGYVFQSLALWPHLSVRGHLEFVLDRARKDGRARLERILLDLGLDRLADRRPGELSGGERQRLALARALVNEPPLLLLDEPTSSVDQSLKAEVRELLSSRVRASGTTVLHVTHDQKEAFALADRIFVMIEGRIVQAGGPEEIYTQPQSRAVARLIGEGTLVPISGAIQGSAESPLGRVSVLPRTATGSGWALVRPESLALQASGGVKARVVRSIYRAPDYTLSVQVGDLEFFVVSARPMNLGDEVRVVVMQALPVVEGRHSS